MFPNMRIYSYIAAAILFCSLMLFIFYQKIKLAELQQQYSTVQGQLELCNLSIDSYKDQSDKAVAALQASHKAQDKIKAKALAELKKSDQKLIIPSDCLGAVKMGAMEGIKINANY